MKSSYQELAVRPCPIPLDIGLPELNRYEVARLTRKEKDLENVLLVALSGYGQEGDKQNSFAHGFDYHMVKPVNYEFLLEELLPSLHMKNGNSHIERKAPNPQATPTA